MKEPLEFTLQATGPATDLPTMVDRLNAEAREKVGHDDFHCVTQSVQGQVERTLTMVFREGKADPGDDLAPPDA